jgi:hypothetical protein
VLGQDGQWRISRILSFAHSPAEREAAAPPRHLPLRTLGPPASALHPPPKIR